MKIERRYTTADRPVVDQIEWKTVRSEIMGKDGPIFLMEHVEVPHGWSSQATDIFAQKYLRKAGVPNDTYNHNSDNNPVDFSMPQWLRTSKPIVGTVLGPETSAKQVFHRMAGCWTYWGWREGMFGHQTWDTVNGKPSVGHGQQSEEHARAFYDELYYMLAMQVAAPNSPQWFNTGLFWAYGITGSAGGSWATNHETGELYETESAYERPQPHACFIQPVSDDLVNHGGIMDLWLREVRLFKGGSGTGTNFSNIRGKGEPLSNGGVSSGLMSFLRIGDQAAGSIKSGGTTRRAAKMVVLDLDHPEIEDFVEWKVREENKAAAMYVGSQLLRNYHLDVGDAVDDPHVAVPEAMIDRSNHGFEPEIFGVGWEEEAISSVSGQNSNNSVRVTNEFMKCVDIDAPWSLKTRTYGKTVRVLSSKGLWEKICRAAWASADPGVQFHDIINEWHTCPNDGAINASNPCSEYVFLDNTACFVGETSVWTANGPRTFSELAATGATVPVLTELDDGKLAYRDMVAPRLTHRDQPIVEVTFKARGARGRKNSFTTVRVTSDHNFYMRDGYLRQAKDLQEGDSVESAYRSAKNYVSLYTTSGDNVREHVLAAEYVHGRRANSRIEHAHHVDRKDCSLTPNHTVVGVRYLEETADVYCGTVPTTGRFFISLGTDHREGVLVKNCNLASLNLDKFRVDDGSIDVNRYEHAVRLWTIVLEISVEMASYPSREIAEMSERYRTLGLGIANLGGLLMKLAIPYDSDEGRALAAALQALMTGVAYRTSAEMAAELGPFQRWEANAEPMRRVLWNHREAILGTSGDYKGLSIWPYDAIPRGINRSDLAHQITDAAASTWNEVINAKSFRNAQVTLTAPTGTIRLVMDCETSGMEPEFALISHKFLAGGGEMTFVNGAVKEALKRLGYNSVEISGMETWIKEHGSLEGLLMPAEGLAVFDTANPARPGGRCLDVMAHVKMLAAITPFLSGSASKTANLPQSATVSDVDRVYREAHRLGIKAIALYRDGSKLTQPLSSGVSKIAATPDEVIVASDLPEVKEELFKKAKMVGSEPLPRGAREYLPWRRKGSTQKVKIDGQSIFMTINEYPDGRPAEMFIELSREGSTLRAMANLVAMAVSLGLQHGVPVAEFVDRFTHAKFEPAGLVEGHNRIKMASSIADFIGRELGITYCGRDDLAHVVDSLTMAAVEEIHNIITTERRRPKWVAQATQTGEVCSCGTLMQHTGTCLTCPNCGANSGCG